MSAIYEKGSSWRKWDLQVQTILDENYSELSTYYESLKKDEPVKWKEFTEKLGSEEKALKYDSKDYFFTDATDSEKTRARNYAKTFISFLEIFHGEEACIAITDHNYDHPYLLDEFREVSLNSKIKVICGVEINVMGVHILALFDDILYKKETFSDGIRTFLSSINIHNKKQGNVLTVSDKAYTEVIDLIIKNNGIVIYPHCNSDNGLFQERGKTDRTHLAGHFNYQEFNILQGKNESNCKSTETFISTKPKLTSKFCFTLASDSRCLADILMPDEKGNYTWIKGDPTFEGLKQITYESDLRIRLQASLPEDKPGYQVIDFVKINNNLIYNNKIELNPNLNSVIGGRSTGKSVLLTAIAKKLKTEKPVIFANKHEYNEFVKSISDSIDVVWKDGEVNNDREIEFFQQGYMYELAINKKRLSKLVEDILKQKGKSELIQSFSAKKSEAKKKISSLLSDVFQVIHDISEKESQKSDKGDKKGIEDEIKRLSEELKKLNSTDITEENRESYEKQSEQLEKWKSEIEAITKDKERVSYMKSLSLVRDNISYELTSVSESTKNAISTIFSDVKKEADLSWVTKLEGIASTLDTTKGQINTNIQLALEDDTYKKVSNAYKESIQLSELEEKIKIQRRNLLEITSIIDEITSLNKQRKELISDVLVTQGSYYNELMLLIPKLSIFQDGLKISAQPIFEDVRYREILHSAINQQSQSNQQLSNYSYTDNKQYSEHVTKLFNLLLEQKLTLKSGYSNRSLCDPVLSECFHSISYDLEYEDDSFDHMSDGKKAFVVLKLLLDFSDKNCPILIDQPEDDLDNRAIYQDLVQYIKSKKTKRQILLATHNPNIVVGADSELVAIANQNGSKSKNHNGKKFEYITGSLENTMPLDSSIQYILDTQGIREHVCSILEGGDTAFKLREKKYGIK